MEAYQPSKNQNYPPPHSVPAETLKSGAALADDSLQSIRGYKSGIFEPDYVERERLKRQIVNDLRQASEIYRDSWLAERAERMDRCCRPEDSKFLYCKKDGATTRIPDYRCDIRGCPHCDRRKAAKIAEENYEYMLMMNRPRFLTLNMAHSKGESCGQVYQRMISAKRKLIDRVRKSGKGYLKAGIWAHEATYSKDHGWHWHIHAIIDGDFWDIDDMSRRWSGSGGGFAWIEPVKDRKGAAKELAHYVAKQSSFSGDAHIVGEFYRFIRGKRLKATTGAINGLKTKIMRVKKVARESQDADDYESKRIRYSYFLGLLFQEMRQRGLKVSAQFKKHFDLLYSFDPPDPFDCPVCGSRREIYGLFSLPDTVFH